MRYDGTDLLALPEVAMRAYRGGKIAMIFQEPSTSLNPVLTVGQQIAEVLARHLAVTDHAQPRVLLGLDPQQRGVELGLREIGALLAPAGPELAGLGQP